jgi:hypothetical protein
MKLEVIFEGALGDRNALSIDTKGYWSRLTKGVKIVKDVETGIIAIYNTFSKGHFPKEITSEQYTVFTKHGWVEGVRHIQIYNLNKEIISLKCKIQQERATNKNSRRIKSLINKLKNAKDECKTIRK